MVFLHKKKRPFVVYGSAYIKGTRGLMYIKQTSIVNRSLH